MKYQATKTLRKVCTELIKNQQELVYFLVVLNKLLDWNKANFRYFSPLARFYARWATGWYSNSAFTNGYEDLNKILKLENGDSEQKILDSLQALNLNNFRGDLIKLLESDDISKSWVIDDKAWARFVKQLGKQLDYIKFQKPLEGVNFIGFQYSPLAETIKFIVDFKNGKVAEFDIYPF